ncbi:MAG: hypothetical protein K6A44_05890 [bacterium]|nr:hypothetical protein [bacterium]
MKKLLLLIAILFLSAPTKAEDLNLTNGRVYVLNFDSDIENFHVDEKKLDAQILHSIFNDKRQLILVLKEDKDTVLQVKTEDKLINYDIKPSSQSSVELIEIDLPPFENLDVDIFDGV